MIAEFTAAIIAKCCDTQVQQKQLEEAGAIQPLVNLLHSDCIKAQEASLDAIATLCRENKDLGETIIRSKCMSNLKKKAYVWMTNIHIFDVAYNTEQLTTNTMLNFVKDKCPNMRLIASTW